MWGDGFKDTFRDVLLCDKNGMRLADVHLWNQNQSQSLTLTNDIGPKNSGFETRQFERNFADDAVFHNAPPWRMLRTLDGCHVLPFRVGIPLRFRQSAIPWRVRTPAD